MAEPGINGDGCLGLSRDMVSLVDRLGSLARLLASMLLILSSVAVVRIVSAAELDWQAPVGCPAREIVEHRVSVAIGMPLEQAGNARFKCEVTQLPNGSFRLKLRVEGPSAHADDPPRTIEADTCDRVADTAVVAIALALGANSVAPTQSGTEGPTSDVQPTDGESSVSVTDQTKKAEEPAEKAVPAPPSTSSSTSSHFWAAARLGPVVDLGSLPGLALGLEPAFDLGYRAVSAHLSGTVFGSKRATLSDGSGAEFSLWSVALSACGNTQRQRTHATLCAGAEVGRMTGSGFGALRVARQGSALWVTPIVQAQLVTAPWLFGMRSYIGAMAGMPLIRRPFTFGNVEVVHRAENIVGRLGAGLEIDWP